MSDWKTAQEIRALTQQSINERNELISLKLPIYMNQAMEFITEAAAECRYEARFELRPHFCEDYELFDQTILAIRKKLKSLGYQVSNNHARFGFRVSWN